MPSNIFSTTDTNVSIVFMDKTNKDKVVLIDASNLGESVKDGKNQKTVLTPEEEQQIIDTFNYKKALEDFSVVVGYDEIKQKNYSLSAGQYFEVKIEYVEITAQEFEAKMKGFEENLNKLFAESRALETEIQNNLKGLWYGGFGYAQPPTSRCLSEVEGSEVEGSEVEGSEVEGSEVEGSENKLK